MGCIRLESVHRSSEIRVHKHSMFYHIWWDVGLRTLRRKALTVVWKVSLSFHWRDQTKACVLFKEYKCPCSQLTMWCLCLHLTNWNELCASVLWFVVFQTSTKGPFSLQGVVCVTLKDVGFMTWCRYVTILANHMWFSCIKVHGFVLHYGSICCFIP